jgi:hypothetical protein
VAPVVASLGAGTVARERNEVRAGLQRHHARKCWTWWVKKSDLGGDGTAHLKGGPLLSGLAARNDSHRYFSKEMLHAGKQTAREGDEKRLEERSAGDFCCAHRIMVGRWVVTKEIGSLLAPLQRVIWGKPGDRTTRLDLFSLQWVETLETIAVFPGRQVDARASLSNVLGFTAPGALLVARERVPPAVMGRILPTPWASISNVA